MRFRSFLFGFVCLTVFCAQLTFPLSAWAVTVTDPIGDTFGQPTDAYIHDVTSVTLFTDGQQLVFEVEFVEPVVPETGDPPFEDNALYGFVDLDLDQDSTTGFGGNPSVWCVPPSDLLGVDAIIALHFYDEENGTVNFVRFSDDTTFPVPALFLGNRVRVEVPLAFMEDDGIVDMGGVVFSRVNPNDCFPNDGVITSDLLEVTEIPSLGGIGMGILGLALLSAGFLNLRVRRT